MVVMKCRRCKVLSEVAEPVAKVPLCAGCAGVFHRYQALGESAQFLRRFVTPTPSPTPDRHHQQMLAMLNSAQPGRRVVGYYVPSLGVLSALGQPFTGAYQQQRCPCGRF